MFDITGRKILNQYIDNSTVIPVYEYQKGIYFVRIIDQNKIVHSEKISIY